jgi:Domain of unknown function (DUF4136)
MRSARCRSAWALGVALVLSGLSGCLGGPQYRANVDPAVDLRSYRTFGFLDEGERTLVPYQASAIRHLKTAIRREMQAHGYQPSEKPDLLINLHVQKRDAAQTNAASDYYAYRNGRYAWRAGVPTESVSYVDGTLNVDVVDAAGDRLIWEGIAIGSISQRMYENLESTIDSVAAKLFERFPPRSQT